MENNFDNNEALDLIKTGLESGAIKLIGNSGQAAKVLAERDAEYLLTLYVQLQKGLQPQQG